MIVCDVCQSPKISGRIFVSGGSGEDGTGIEGLIDEDWTLCLEHFEKASTLIRSIRVEIEGKKDAPVS